MKIFYEEIDGMLHPKLLIIPFSEDRQEKCVSIEITAPFERMYSEDFHDDFKALTITQGEMQRDYDKETTILIDLELVRRYMMINEINPALIFEIDYFVMLLDDIEEILQMDVRRFYLK